MDKVTHFQAQLDKELSKYPLAKQLEIQTGVPKTYLAVGVSGVLFLLIFFNIGAGLLTNLIGFLYPAYASFRAIESATKSDDTQWLTYWTVFGFLQIVETFVDVVLSWFPFYYLFKVVGLVYLLAPGTKGAELLYVRFLRPMLLQHVSDIKLPSPVREESSKSK